MPSAPATPFAPTQFEGWASFYGGNVVAPTPPPPSTFGLPGLGQPPANGQYTGGWAYPDAWANFYEGKQGFQAPQNQFSASGALAATYYARNANNPNDPNLLGWEQAYGNPNTILQVDQNWADSLGSAPIGTPSNELTGGWQNPEAWAAFYGGSHGFTAPDNAGSPASALAAAAQIAKTSNPQDNPALLGWVQDYGQPGSVLAATPNWAASLGSPQVNSQGQGFGQTNTQGWDSPLAWAAYYGGFQGYTNPVDNTLEAAQNWAGVTNLNDPSLLGWELDYGNPQTVVSFLEGQQNANNQVTADQQAYLDELIAQNAAAQATYDSQLAAFNAQQAQIASQQAYISSLTSQEAALQAKITQLQRTDPTGANAYISQLRALQAQLGQQQTQLSALSAGALTQPAPLGSNQTAPGFAAGAPSPATKVPLSKVQEQPILLPSGVQMVTVPNTGTNKIQLASDGSIYVNGQLYQMPIQHSSQITGPLAATLPPPEVEVSPGTGSPTNTALGASFGHGATGANAGQLAGPAFGPTGNFENVIQAFGSAGAPLGLQQLAAEILAGLMAKLATLNSTASGGGALGGYVPASMITSSDVGGAPVGIDNPFYGTSQPFGPTSVFSGTPLTKVGQTFFQAAYGAYANLNNPYNPAADIENLANLIGASQQGLTGPGLQAPGAGEFQSIGGGNFFNTEPTFASLNYTPQVFNNNVDDFIRSDLGGIGPLLSAPSMPDFGGMATTIAEVLANLGTGWTPPPVEPNFPSFSLPDFGGLETNIPQALSNLGIAYNPSVEPNLSTSVGDALTAAATALGNLFTVFNPQNESGLNPDVTFDQVVQSGQPQLGQEFIDTVFGLPPTPPADIPRLATESGFTGYVTPGSFPGFPDTAPLLPFEQAPTVAPGGVPSVPSDVFTDPLVQGGPYANAPGMVVSSKDEEEEPGVYPPDANLTPAEKGIQKFGGKATLYQLAQAKGGDAAQKMLDNRSYLGEGAFTYVLDLSKPLEPQIEKAIPSAFGGERGTVAGKVIEAMQASAPSAAVQQHLMQFAGQTQQDVKADVQQDIAESGDQYYRPAVPSMQYNIVPGQQYYQPGPNYNPDNIRPPGDIPYTNAPMPTADVPRPPADIPQSFAFEGQPYMGGYGAPLAAPAAPQLQQVDPWAQAYGTQPIQPQTFQFGGGQGVAKMAPDGNPPAAVIIHTSDTPYQTAQEQVEAWKTDTDPARQGIGSTFIVDRDGKVWRTQEDLGYSGNENFHNSRYPGINNGTTVSMEFLGRNEGDITPQMKQAGIDFLNTLYGDTPVLAHSQVSPEDRTNEGENIANATGRVPQLGGYLPTPRDRPTGDVGSGSTYYPAPPTATPAGFTPDYTSGPYMGKGPQDPWAQAYGNQYVTGVQGGPAAGAPGESLSYTPGTMGFLHGMESRYGQTSVGQIEADARAIADELGLNFKVIGGSGDNVPAQMAAVRDYLANNYDLSALLGFSAGAGTINAIGQTPEGAGLTYMPIAGVQPQEGWYDPAVPHMQQLAAYGDFLSDRSGLGYNDVPRDVYTEAWPGSGQAPSRADAARSALVRGIEDAGADFGRAALYGRGGPTVEENISRLHPDFATNLDKAITAANEQGYNLYLSSGYRDPEALNETGQGGTGAARFDARGLSIHSTGMAGDIGNMPHDSASVKEIRQIFADNGITFPYPTSNTTEWNHVQLAGTPRQVSPSVQQLNLQGAPMEQRWQAFGFPAPQAQPQPQPMQMPQGQQYFMGAGQQELSDEQWFQQLQQVPADFSTFNYPSPNVEDRRLQYIPAAEPESADFIWDNAGIGPQGQTGNWGVPTSAPPIGQGYGGGPQEFAPIPDIGQLLQPTQGGLGGGTIGPVVPQALQAALNYINPPQAPSFDQVATPNYSPTEPTFASLQPQALEPPNIPALQGGAGGYSPTAFGGGYNPPADAGMFYGGYGGGFNPSPFPQGAEETPLTPYSYEQQSPVFKSGSLEPGKIYSPTKTTFFGSTPTYTDTQNVKQYDLGINPTKEAGISAYAGGVSLPERGHYGDVVLVMAPNGEWSWQPVVDVGPRLQIPGSSGATLDLLTATANAAGYPQTARAGSNAPDTGWQFMLSTPGAWTGPPPTFQGGPMAGYPGSIPLPGAPQPPAMPMLRYVP